METTGVSGPSVWAACCRCCKRRNLMVLRLILSRIPGGVAAPKVDIGRGQRGIQSLSSVCFTGRCDCAISRIISSFSEAGYLIPLRPLTQSCFFQIARLTTKNLDIIRRGGTRRVPGQPLLAKLRGTLWTDFCRGFQQCCRCGTRQQYCPLHATLPTHAILPSA